MILARHSIKFSKGKWDVLGAADGVFTVRHRSRNLDKSSNIRLQLFTIAFLNAKKITFWIIISIFPTAKKWLNIF